MNPSSIESITKGRAALRLLVAIGRGTLDSLTPITLAVTITFVGFRAFRDWQFWVVYVPCAIANIIERHYVRISNRTSEP
jgi:hypothetical protein